jgi:hypothetical protein
MGSVQTEDRRFGQKMLETPDGLESRIHTDATDYTDMFLGTQSL